MNINSFYSYGNNRYGNANSNKGVNAKKDTNISKDTDSESSTNTNKNEQKENTDVTQSRLSFKIGRREKAHGIVYGKKYL